MCTRPQLLVSVTSLSEARLAEQAGADLIDIKDPTRGPLGMADFSLIRSISGGLSSSRLSIACGEALDWTEPLPLDGPVSGVQFLKLGPAGLSRRTDWQQCWLESRDRVNLHFASDSPPAWIAVVYADYQAAAAPEPEALIRFAIESGCVGVLFDTACKQGPALTGCLTRSELQRHLREIRRAGLLSALAGRLQLADLGPLAELGPDIIGVRSAACYGGARLGGIDPAAVTKLKQTLLESRPSTSSEGAEGSCFPFEPAIP
ncbi:(5-formylfuran-3-yl)methyl phosphate synthase [Planctomicrobium sp. SH664]|uniref:(5-formylfuran-3-yl)methyl phosphate synthase n=1 Tax=Planctomicrobium sp. SH664 TaxID=3448125 RepID=UPI003F5B633D